MVAAFEPLAPFSHSPLTVSRVRMVSTLINNRWPSPGQYSTETTRINSIYRELLYLNQVTTRTITASLTNDPENEVRDLDSLANSVPKL
jgi:hypothetical protein